MVPVAEGVDKRLPEEFAVAAGRFRRSRVSIVLVFGNEGTGRKGKCMSVITKEGNEKRRRNVEMRGEGNNYRRDKLNQVLGGGVTKRCR
jgi:hypothetical protein